MHFKEFVKFQDGSDQIWTECQTESGVAIFRQILEEGCTDLADTKPKSSSPHS